MSNSYAALETLFGLTTIQMAGLRRDSNRRPYARLPSGLATSPPKLPLCMTKKGNILLIVITRMTFVGYYRHYMSLAQTERVARPIQSSMIIML